MDEAGTAGRCPHCGAKLLEHRHSLNTGLVEGLRKLAAVEGPINLKLLGLTRNQWDNFQKLRYWGLVRQVRDGDQRRRGVWEATAEGRAFLAGALAVPRRVRTFRGTVVAGEGGTIRVADVGVKAYRQREHYAADAVPRGPAVQAELF